MLLNYVLIASLYIYSCDSLIVSKQSSAGQASILPDFLLTLDFLALQAVNKALKPSLGSPVHSYKELDRPPGFR